jgi:ketosteroid isomerase-like protein
MTAIDPKPTFDHGAESMTEEIERAKAVIASHEQFSRDGDLGGILTNVADDIVLVVPNAPLVEGKEAFQGVYSSLLSMGCWDFVHDYSSAEVVDHVVILHGVARGTFTPNEGNPSPIENNFLLLPKRVGKSFVIWRGAFGPAS